MGVKIRGVSATIDRIARAQNTVFDEVKAEVLKGGLEILELSRGLANFKTGALEQAHDIEEDDMGDSGISVEVFVDDSYRADKWHVVGDYVDFIHDDENYQYGAGTLAKPSVAGMRPGRRFLRRAAEHLEKRIVRDVSNTARRASRRYRQR